MSDNGRAERVCRPEGSMCKVARLASWEANLDPEQIIVPSHRDNVLVGAGSGLASRGRRLQAATTILGGTAALFKVGSAGGEAFRAAVAATLGVAITAVEMDDATPPVDVSATKAAKTALRRRRLLASARARASTTLSSVTIDFTVTMPGAEGKVTKAFLTGLGRNPTFVVLLCAELAKAQLSLEAGACQAPAGSKAAWEEVVTGATGPHGATGASGDEDRMMAALNKLKATASLDLSHKTAGKITDLVAARKAKAAAATAAAAAAVASAAAAGEKLFNLTSFSSGGNLTNFSSGGNLTNASLPLNASSITAIITATTTAPPTTTTTTPKAKRKTCSIVGGIEVGGYTRDNLRDVFGSGPIRRLIAAKAGNGATAELVLLEKFLPSKTNTETVVVEFRVMSAAQVREGGGCGGVRGNGERG
jgi:hypothetical protein